MLNLEGRSYVEALVARIPIFEDGEDRLLVKQALMDLREPDVKTALSEHNRVEQTLLYLTYKYQRLAQDSQRNHRSHTATETNHLFESSGLAVAKAETKVEAMKETQDLLRLSNEAEARYDFLRNLSFSARNRLRAIEHLANYERLETKLDTASYE